MVALCAVALCACSCARESALPPPGTARQVYVTWNTLETDKLASIWLIKRFIDPEAHFIFVPKDTLITNGIPFDTPDSEFRRYQTLSCFQSILQKHSITNAALLRIGEFTHDIEINFWGEKRFLESTDLAARINSLIDTSATNPPACVEGASAILDALYQTARISAP
jgi:hypothetical protein